MSSLQPSPGPSSQSVSTKSKAKQHSAIGSGIAAGAEDAKYQAKYKDLKRKVNDIENENDKLLYKVLQAKRSIQRMQLERAILYERLSGPPPNVVDVRGRHAPPVHNSGAGNSIMPPSARGFPSHQDALEHRSIMDNDRTIPENSVPHERHRMLSGPDGRAVPALDSLNQGSSGVPSPHLRSPTVQHSTSRQSSRHQIHIPTVPGLPELSPCSSRAHVSPDMHHTQSNSSHERHEHSGSHSSSRHRTRHSSSQAYYEGPPRHPQQYLEDTPLHPQHTMHSPPLAERERSRHHDEYLSHGNGRHPGYVPQNSPPIHTSDVRSSHRPHNHQRVGPASYINRDDPMYDRQREIEREREWDRDRERNREYSRGGRDLAGSQVLTSPPAPHRLRQSSDRGDLHHPEHGLPTSQMREEQVFYRDHPPAPGGYPLQSRSGSPGSSGSGIGAGEIPSRPDSRTHYYEPYDRSGYRTRPSKNHPSEDVDRDYLRDEPRSTHNHGGGGNNFPAQEPNNLHPESRKRGRSDMDVDSDDAEDGEPIHYRGGGKHDDRGSKRYQREHVRSLDEPEDARVGPP